MSLSEELTDWVKANCPSSLLGGRHSYGGGSHQPIEDPDFQVWFDACLERGLTAPDWPVELGGGGLTSAETRTFYDVLKSLRAPNPLSGSGKAMLGPLILELGTEDQKKKHNNLILKHLNNKDIFKVFKEFKKTIDIKSSYVAAISGGPDSLALAFLTKVFSK